MKINTQAIPLLSNDVIARNDKNGMLLFQVYSDEMYFISREAYNHLISRCDGSRTIQEIIDMVKMDTQDKSEHICEFFKNMEQRQIITLW